MQSFDKNSSGKIQVDNCVSESKRSTQVYSNKKLNENPEFNISRSISVDFKSETTLETVTKRKYDVKKLLDVNIQVLNNVSKANNDSNNDNRHNRIKYHVSYKE